MKIAGIYSFNNGKEVIEKNFKKELIIVRDVISNVNGNLYRNKVSKEKAMPGKKLYSPSDLNKAFKAEFEPRGWSNYKVSCDYPTEFYVGGFALDKPVRGAFRDMDFVKNRMGVEVQFGKYAFMVYNVCAKMTIFNKMDVIDVGVEIVPIKSLADEMSTGVSYFEQFVWDLEHRGISDIDIPVLILGITVE